MTHLWGKSQAERDADRQQVLFEREEIARRDEELRLRRMSPAELAVRYAPGKPRTIVLQPEVVRNFHFGTDIPIPSNDEVAESLERRIPPGQRWGLVLMAVAAWGVVLAFAAAILYLALAS